MIFSFQAIARPASMLFARGMAGPAKVLEVSQEDIYGPATVERDVAKIEMGVRYEAGVPSPMEGAHYNDPIVVDGLIAKTGGEGLGCPVQYIKLSAWCAVHRHPCARMYHHPCARLPCTHAQRRR